MSDFESGAFNRALPTLRFVTTKLSGTCDRLSLDRFRLRTSGVRFGVPSVSRFLQLVDCRRLVLGSEMGVPHDHLERPVPEQLCDSTQIYSSHLRVYLQKVDGCNARCALRSSPLRPRWATKPRDPSRNSPLRTEGKTGIGFTILPSLLFLAAPRPATAVQSESHPGSFGDRAEKSPASASCRSA